MAERFFRKFPTIVYDGRPAVDLTHRVSLLDSVLKNPYLYYKYDVTQGERADQVATTYYDDPFLDWLIYLSNKITDPYHGWQLTPREFSEFIRKKYGSEPEARNRIAYYRCNWYEHDDDINVSTYNALTIGEQKYFEPIYRTDTEIRAYRRRRLDWIIDTNQIVRYTANGTGFEDNERVSIVISTGQLAAGHVAHSNSTTVTVHHTSGVTLSNSTVVIDGNSAITGAMSNTVAAITADELVVNTIPADEVVYWSPVTYYEVEEERNAQSRSIRLLDKRYAQQTADAVEEVLNR